MATSLLGFIDMNGQVLYASLPDRPGGGGFANGFAAWAPDGRRLAVVRQQANSPAEIWLLELEAAQPYSKLVEFPPGRGFAGSPGRPMGAGSSSESTTGPATSSCSTARNKSARPFV